MTKLLKKESLKLQSLKEEAHSIVENLRQARTLGRKKRKNTVSLSEKKVIEQISSAVKAAMAFRDKASRFCKKISEEKNDWVQGRSESYWRSQRCVDFEEWSRGWEEAGRFIQSAWVRHDYLTVTNLKHYEEALSELHNLTNEPEYREEIQCSGFR